MPDRLPRDSGISRRLRSKGSTILSSDPRIWFIESYDNATITGKNDHNTYKARCEGHRILGPDRLVYDAEPSFPCSMAISAVGANIEPITFDTDFRKLTLVMGRGPSGSLILRKGDMIETFTVTSVTNDPP